MKIDQETLEALPDGSRALYCDVEGVYITENSHGQRTLIFLLVEGSSGRMWYYDVAEESLTEVAQYNPPGDGS